MNALPELPVTDDPSTFENRLDAVIAGHDVVLARFAELEARVYRMIADTERIAVRIHPLHPWSS